MRPPGRLAVASALPQQRTVTLAGAEASQRREFNSASVYCPKVVPFTPPKPMVPPPADLVGSTVLVVDDERAWRLILETDLRLLGYRVSLAQDAVEALARARQDCPDVAIVDLMLPEPMDGSALPSELRAQGTPVPVVLFTAYPVFDQGPDDPDVIGCVSKAEDRADLYALLPGAIKKKRSRR